MLTEFSYLALEIVAITTLLLFVAITISSFPKNRSAWLFAFICVSNVSYLLVRMSFKENDAFSLDPGFFMFPAQIFMNAGSGLWMLFCFSIFRDKPRIPKILLFLFFLQLALSTLRVYLVPMSLSELDLNAVIPSTWAWLLTLPLLLQGVLGMIAFVVIIESWSDDLINTRRIFRSICLIYLGFFGIGIMLIEIAQPFISVSLRYLLNNVITIAYALTACGMLVVVTRINTSFLDSVFIKVSSTVSRTLNKENPHPCEADYQQFLEVFEDNKAYLEHGLSIAALAKKMAIPQYRLRQLINSYLGYRNFNALLHAYRIRDACEQLSNPEKRDLPVLTIALSLGYQSIAPFNQAFRELVGQTPSSFRHTRISEEVKFSSQSQ